MGREWVIDDHQLTTDRIQIERTTMRTNERCLKRCTVAFRFVGSDKLKILTLLRTCPAVQHPKINLDRYGRYQITDLRSWLLLIRAFHQADITQHDL